MSHMKRLALDLQDPRAALIELYAQVDTLRTERDDWIACHAKVFRKLQDTKQIVGNQAERIAELEGALYGARNALSELAEDLGGELGQYYGRKVQAALAAAMPAKEDKHG